MKIDIFKSLIAAIAGILIAYGFYTFCHSDYRQLLVYTCFAEMLLTGIVTTGVKFELSRTNTLVKVVSLLYFFVFLITNIIFSFLPFTRPVYIIINGLIFLSGMLIIYSLLTAKQ